MSESNYGYLASQLHAQGVNKEVADGVPFEYIGQLDDNLEFEAERAIKVLAASVAAGEANHTTLAKELVQANARIRNALEWLSFMDDLGGLTPSERQLMKILIGAEDGD